MDIERAYEIIQSNTYVPVFLNLKQVYLENVDAQKGLVQVCDVNNPNERQMVSIEELSEGTTEMW